MNDEMHPPLDRLTELLADRALFGLDDAEQRELDTLMAATDQQKLASLIASLEGTTASAQLATLGQVEALPTELADKLAEQGRQILTSDMAAVDQVQLAPRVAKVPRREFLAWFSTAAAVAFAWFTVTRKSDDPSPAALRAELMTLADTQPNAVTKVSWTSTDESVESDQGDVVWHHGRQAGVMKFTGLPANDPTVEQYQLWIFDAEQDEAHPIDGGVFDVPAGADEVLVRIDAKLQVVEPTLFAITIEKPGGVVVSSRERLPLLAKVE